MWMGQNLKAIASNIIILQTIQQKTGIHFHRLYAIRRGRPDQGVPLWIVGMSLLVYGAFFQASPVMYIVYITFQAGRPSRVGPYAGPGRGVFYELRVARSDVVSLSLSRRNAASESAKKAVARGSWFVARKSSPSFRTGAPRGRPYKTWNIMLVLCQVWVQIKLRFLSISYPAIKAAFFL